MKKKKLYYKFVDLQRAACYLADEENLLLANKMIRHIQAIKEDRLDKPMCAKLFDKYEFELVNEYLETDTVQSIDNCISKIPSWLWLLIKPEYLDLNDLRQIIDRYGIDSKEALLNFFASREAEARYGKEYASLYYYFVQNQDGSNFQLKYRNFPNESDALRLEVNDATIKGNFHNHSLYSDGQYEICELKQLAKNAGREYIGISDHSCSVGGVDSERLLEQIKGIDALNKYDGPLILKGIECEILNDGSLDMPNDILQQLDYVIVACHRNVVMKKSEATNRIVKAVENYNSNILAHPQSRIFQKKVGLYLDMHKIIDACVGNGVVIEINGNPDRLDLAPEYIQYAMKQNVLFTVDSDTHGKYSFKNINNAIHIAEDHFIDTDHIINTKGISEIKHLFNRHK